MKYVGVSYVLLNSCLLVINRRDYYCGYMYFVDFLFCSLCVCVYHYGMHVIVLSRHPSSCFGFKPI